MDSQKHRMNGTMNASVIKTKINQRATYFYHEYTTFHFLLLVSNKPSQIHSDNPSGHLGGSAQIDSNVERQQILKV